MVALYFMVATFLVFVAVAFYIVTKDEYKDK